MAIRESIATRYLNEFFKRAQDYTNKNKPEQHNKKVFDEYTGKFKAELSLRNRLLPKLRWSLIYTALSIVSSILFLILTPLIKSSLSVAIIIFIFGFGGVVLCFYSYYD